MREVAVPALSEPDTLRSVRTLVERALTGRLSVVDENGEVALYLLDGQIIGACSDQDGPVLLDRLTEAGLISGSISSKLQNLSEAALRVLRKQVGDPLIRRLTDVVANDVLDDELALRLLENVQRFIRSTARPEYEPDALPWIYNIDLTLDASALIDGHIERRAPCSEQNEVPYQAVAELLEVADVEEVIEDADEAIEEVQEVIEDIDEDVDDADEDVDDADEDVDDADEAIDDPNTDSSTSNDTTSADPDDTSSDVPDDLAPRYHSFDDDEGDAFFSGQDTAVDNLPAEEDDDDDATVLLDASLTSAIRIAAPSVDGDVHDNPQEADEPAAPVEAQVTATPIAEDPAPTSQVDMVFDESEPDTFVEAMEPVPAIQSNRDDDLDAFSGAADDVRGGGREGVFVTSSANLDRITLDTPPSTPRSRSSSYSAPHLDQEAAYEKIHVANEVLAHIAEAYQAGGLGSTQSAIQQLLDTSNRTYAPILLGLNATEEGTLPADLLLDALHKRPDAEQRLLLRGALIDLLERAIDHAADTLEDDDQIDNLLERVMGFRQRIGL